jgi:hypothetical protein
MGGFRLAGAQSIGLGQVGMWMETGGVVKEDKFWLEFSGLLSQSNAAAQTP